MAILVSTNGYILVNAVNLSDHCTSLSMNDGQETRDCSTFTTGTPMRVFRAGLTTASVSATFKNDHASGSVESTLRGLVSSSSTGFPLVVQKIAGSATVPTSTNNPKYTFSAVVIDGDLNVLNDSVGEIAEISARFVPYTGSLTVSTSATS